MLGRRTVTALLASTIAAPAVTFAQAKRAQSVFYNAVGPTLTCWHADIDAAGDDGLHGFAAAKQLREDALHA